jgi:hypothetical protein
VVAAALFIGVLVVVVPSGGVVVEDLSLELLPATTGSPTGATGVSVAELLVPESTTICCTCLLLPRCQQNVSSRKVYLSLLMPPYFPWNALSMFV